MEIIFFMLLGICLGIIMGLLPGVHPNMIVLLLPVLIAAQISTLPMLAMIVAMGAANSIVDFVPSILLGAPDGNELSALPGHRMLLAGHGYNAIKLSVIGALGAVVLVALLFPLLVFAVPAVYGFLKPVIPLLLVLVLATIVLSEKGNKKYLSFGVMLLAGVIGAVSPSLGINSTLVLFPIFTGFFGISVLLLQLRFKTKLPRQRSERLEISRKTVNRSILFGSLGGMASGFLPGVGSSEIAAVASVDKNEKSFLVTVGAISAANIILSIMSLWLIGNARSGLAVVIENLAELSFAHVVFILFVALAGAGIASVATLLIAKKSISVMQKLDYSKISVCVIAFLAAAVIFFTGATGFILLTACAALGVFTNVVRLRRGILMSVLIIPTLVFYAGF